MKSSSRASTRDPRQRPFEIRVANGAYRLAQKIGSGSFGVIYKGTHVETGQKVAVKLEKANTRHPQLQYESRIYKHMKGSIGVPNVYFYGQEDEYFVLVMDLLGPSLEDLFNYCGRSFSLKTVLLLAEQMLDRIESVHSFEFIHRDIKPDNFLIGLTKNFNTVYIIDFGLSKRYINPKTRRHIPFIEGKSLTGTARYASINTHLGYEQARRDDLETLGYVLMYFNRGGKLPWQGLKAKSKTQKYNRISKVKRETSIDALCQNCPKQFSEYLKYCRNLDFAAKPDYKYMRGLFKDLFKKKGFVKDGRYDWVVKATKALSQSHPRTDSHLSSSRQQKAGRYSNGHATHGGNTHTHGREHSRQKADRRGNSGAIANVHDQQYRGAIANDHSHGGNGGMGVPPPPNQMGDHHGGYGQQHSGQQNGQGNVGMGLGGVGMSEQNNQAYVNYLAAERQRHQRDEFIKAQRALGQGGQGGPQQHQAVHQMAQIHKKSVKNQQPNMYYAQGGMEQQGQYGAGQYGAPGVGGVGVGVTGKEASKSRDKSRKSASNKKGNGYVHPIMPAQVRDQIELNADEQGQQGQGQGQGQGQRGGVLKEYYSSSSSGEDEEHSSSSSTIASTDSDDELNGAWDESSSSGSLSSHTGFLKDGPNIPDLVINNAEEGDRGVGGKKGKKKKKKKKKEKSSRSRKEKSSKKKKKKRKRKKEREKKEKSVSQSKSKRKQKKKRKKKKKKKSEQEWADHE